MNNINNASEFRIAAENAGAEDIYNDGSQEFSMFEDDGNFFIEQFGLRACFDIGQFIEGYKSMPRSRFNRVANKALSSMGYSIRYNEQGTV